MLQNLSEEIRECLRRAEECRRLYKTALSASVIQDYLEMEQRWLALARSYDFTERLSRFVEPFSRKTNNKERPSPGAAR
jgi:enoyl-CoA hydratase/carnithine racemase